MLQFLDNHLNPLFLRELRKLVRNRFIIVLINLFIAMLVLVGMMGVLFQNSSQLTGTGGDLFGGLTAVMVITCFLAVVVYTASTTFSERLGGDLMYASAMKPRAIVFGKAWAGGVLTVLFMSITAPFVMLAYLLRGLDIEWVALSFLYVFIVIQVLNAAAICLFFNVKSRIQVVFLLGVGGFAFLWTLAIIVSNLMFTAYRGARFDLWQAVASHALLALGIIALLLAAAIASISPPTSNRLLPLRLTVTTIYLLSLLFCLLVPSLSGASATLEIWMHAWAFTLFPLMLLAVCERDTWHDRIKKTVPKNVLLRVLAFPFYTGSPNGLVWVALLGAGVGLVHWFWSPGTKLDVTAQFGLFTFDYCVTALLLREFFLRRWLDAGKTWIVVVCILLICTLGGMLAFFLVQYNELTHGDFLDAYEDSVFSILNPFMGRESGHNISLPWVPPLCWAVLLGLPLGAWFIWKVARFSPFAATESMTLEQAEAAVREADANPMVQSERERERKLRGDN